MKNNVIFKKSLALLLAVLVAVSAFASLSLFTSAAASADDLSATFDFENGDASAWVQVGAKSGAETEEGYTDWNYDPSVGDFTGLSKDTIERTQINIANGTNISSSTSKALLVGGYLNVATDYTEENAASSATKKENVAGLTSLVALAQTVDSGTAKAGLTKKSVSGKVSLNYAESDSAGTNIPMAQIGNTNNNKLAFRSTPIIAYYYKDKDNWRGIRLTQVYWNGTDVFDYVGYQLIVCEDGYCYRSAFTTFGNNGNAGRFAGTMADPAYINQFTVSKNFASLGSAVTAKGTTGDGIFPVIAGSRNATVKNTLKATEWLNFNLKYDTGVVTLTLSDATGFSHAIYVPNEAAFTMYNSEGASKTASTIDASTGTFALGSTYSIGTNTFGNAFQSKNAFDDIKVVMTDSSETAVQDVIDAIDSVNDATSFETAKTAYEALTAGQKARVSNAQVYKVLASKYDDKHFVADFSEAWQADVIGYAYTNQITSSKGAVDPTGNWRYISPVNKIVATGDTTNALRIRGGYRGNSFGGGFYLDIDNDALTDIESATISTHNGLVISSASNYATYVTDSTNNGCNTITLLDANNEAKTRDVHKRLYTEKGMYYLSSAWAVMQSYKINVDLMQKFDIVLKPVSATKTKIQFVGYKLEDDGQGTYVATNTYGPTTDSEGKETSYTLDAPINKISISPNMVSYIDIDNVDIKYTGWEKCVKLSTDEAALRDRIAAIGEITIANCATKDTEVSAIRSDYDTLASERLGDIIPDGETNSCSVILANAEAEIAKYTGYVSSAQTFVDTYSTAINYTVANITTIEIAQEVATAKEAYDALSDGVKSVLNNNYSLVGYTFAVGTTLADTLYPVAIVLIPTANQLEFEGYYTDNSLATATSANVDLSKLNTALTKYDNIEDEHKVAVATQYNHLVDLLDGLFVLDDGKALNYDASKYAQYTNIYNYFKDTIFEVNELGYNNNNKTVNAEKFDATKATSMTLAYDYGQINVSGTWSGYKTYSLFNMFPKVNKIDGLANNTYLDYLFSLDQRANKSTVYVDGTNVASSTDKKNVVIPYFNNCFDNNGKGQYYGVARASSAFGQGEVDATYLYAKSKFVNALDVHANATDSMTNYYQAKGDRLCIKMEYEIVYNGNYTAVDTNTYTRVGIKVSNMIFWYEDSSKDGTEGNTPFVLDATYDKGWTVNTGSGDIICSASTGTSEVGFTYAENKVLLPQLFIGDTAISHLQYMNLSREATVAEKNSSILAKAAAGTITDADTNAVLDLFKDYNNLTASEKLLMSAEDLANIEKAIKTIRPNNNGATISLGQTTALGLACKRPTNGKYYKFGVVIASYNTMVDNSATVLDKSTKGAKTFEKLYTDQDAKGDELIFNIYGLFGDNSSEHWDKWIVARFYSVYKDADGNDVIVYNSEAYVDGEGNNNNPTTATAIANDNVTIRSINGVITGAAKKLYSYKDTATLKDMMGESYVNAEGTTLSNYNTTSLATAMATTTDGKLSTAADTLYLLKAFKGVFTAALAPQ